MKILTEARELPANIKTKPLLSRLGANITDALASYTASGLSVTVEAGKVYKIMAAGLYQSNTAGNGIGIRLNGTATVTGLQYQTMILGQTATAYAHGAQTALGGAASGPTISNATVTTNTPFGWQIDGLIRVNAAGTIIVEFRSEAITNGSTLMANSYLELEEVA